MTSQIFKQIIPKENIFELLDSICNKNEKYYIFNNASFKKGLYNGVIDTFIQFCTPFYFLSKRKYLEKKLTHTSFVTILRQLCKSNKINYTSQIKYDKSTYDIIYYIYF